MAENDHLPLTWHIALTTVYALTCYTVIQLYKRLRQGGDPYDVSAGAAQCEVMSLTK